MFRITAPPTVAVPCISSPLQVNDQRLATLPLSKSAVIVRVAAST
jgi:hypothetical protein